MGKTDARYEIILDWSAEDEAYIAEGPELPGCTADGATYRAALENVQVVIDEWIETHAVSDVTSRCPGAASFSRSL